MVNIRRYEVSIECIDALTCFLDTLAGDIIRKTDVPSGVAAISALRLTQTLLSNISDGMKEGLGLELIEEDNTETKH